MAKIFQELSDKYDINDQSYHGGVVHRVLYDETDSPCFLRVATTHHQLTAEEIAKYLPACARETIGTVILSVTEREPNYQLWLDAAQQVKGATITEGRSINHGGYKCYLIAIPGTAK